MIEKEVSEEIKNRLRKVEQEQNVKVLYAVESGSRAWGFASPNSDYDVRFVYANIRDWYFSIVEKRDVIEYPIVDEIDLSGWDVRKALRLFQKSNPSLMEWLHSPIVYFCDGEFAPTLRREVASQYSPMRAVHHYLSMAKTNYRGYLRDDWVPLKKYFYVLRPILAANWVRQYGTMPPILFDGLLETLDPATRLYQSIQILLVLKAQSIEKAMIPADRIINTYIEEQLEQLGAFRQADLTRYSTKKLDELFKFVTA